MHLDRIGEGVVSGTVLAQGALVGYVGNTGNASGGPAHLHFEIHSSSGTPVDPFLRLTSEFPLQEKIVYLSKILTVSSGKKRKPPASRPGSLLKRRKTPAAQRVSRRI